jgi:hypothetical protein
LAKGGTEAIPSRGQKEKKVKHTWEMFVYEFIETGWFSHEDRPKTCEAMRVFYERVPAEALDNLPVELMVFAASPDMLGEVFSWTTFNAEKTAVIYFSPRLEDLPQDEVKVTVPHEMAHVMLGHHEMLHEDFVCNSDEIKDHGDVPGEIKADKLIEKWGYLPAYGRQRNYLKETI